MAKDLIYTAKPKRTPHIPTEEKRNFVSAMAACGVPYEEIATCLKISYDTLIKHYLYELKTGNARAAQKIAAKLFDTAMNGEGIVAFHAQKFWLQTRGGWVVPKSETPETNEVVVRLEGDLITASPPDKKIALKNSGVTVVDVQ